MAVHRRTAPPTSPSSSTATASSTCATATPRPPPWPCSPLRSRSSPSSTGSSGGGPMTSSIDRGSRWRHAAALPLAVVCLLPLAVMVGGSLRQVGLPPPRTPELLSWPIAWENYGRTADLVNLARLTLNSVIVALVAVPLTVLVASWAGFAISRLPKSQARLLLGASLVALMIPLTALLVGRFTTFAWLGLTDTFL